MVQFDETREEFKGFTDYYISELEPVLSKAEGDRVKAVSKFKKVAGLIFVVTLGLAGLAILKTGSVVPVLFVTGFGVVAIFAAFFYCLNDIKAQTKMTLVSGICRYVGWTFSETVAVPPDLDILKENGLLPRRYHRAAFEDEMKGHVHGADFKAVEAHLERKDTDSDGDTKWVTVFRGSLMEIDSHREFLGKTVVLRDAGFFNRKKRSGMKRVGLVDPVFERIFEAYGTDQVEARYLLTPTFMQRLIDLETSVDGKRIRFGFIDGRLLIAVETPNRFEAGSMLKPLTDTERTQKILKEVDAVFGVVDGLMKPQSPVNFNT